MPTERPKRTGIMLAYPFEEKRLAKWQPPYVVQPKLDGERCRLIVRNDGGALLLSSTEEIITSVPHINQLAPRIMPVGEWDGELYVHGWSFEEIHSVVSRSVNLHPNFELMQFHAFDHVGPGVQLERTLTMMNLQNWLENDPVFRVVNSHIVDDFDSLMEKRTEFVNAGYEGIIVRHHAAPYVRKRSTAMMKLKPSRTDAYLIVGYKEEQDKYGLPKNRLGALLCQGDDGTTFAVGSGFTSDDRERLWQEKESLINRYVVINYQHLTPGRGCPRFPIFNSFVVDPSEACQYE